MTTQYYHMSSPCKILKYPEERIVKVEIRPFGITFFHILARDQKTRKFIIQTTPDQNCKDLEEFHTIHVRWGWGDIRLLTDEEAFLYLL